MAKKTKRTVKKRKPAATQREGEPPEPAQYEVTEAPHPGIPRVMVTWHGSGGEERPGPKIWYGMQFEAGKPTPVEHSPFWNAMRADIDRAASTEWTYAHVVEQPEPEPPPPEPLPEPEPDPEARSRRR